MKELDKIIQTANKAMNDIADTDLNNNDKTKIIDTIHSIRKLALSLPVVVHRRELLLAVICEYNRINTYTEIKKVEKWLDEWDSE
jgi:hypothetical protein